MAKTTTQQDFLKDLGVYFGKIKWMFWGLMFFFGGYFSYRANTLNATDERSDLRKDIQIVQQNQEQMKDDIEFIKRALISQAIDKSTKQLNSFNFKPNERTEPGMPPNPIVPNPRIYAILEVPLNKKKYASSEP